MASVLFSVHFTAVVAVVVDWRRKCLTSRVGFRHKHGHNVVGNRTTKSQLLLDVITESQFADDAILLATSEESL